MSNSEAYKQLWKSFNISDQEIYKEHGVEDLLENPYVAFGTIVTGYEQFIFLDKMYTHKFGKKYTRVRDKIQDKYLRNLYNFLANIDYTHTFEKYNITTEFDTTRLLKVLNIFRLYFESEGIEEYEKCAVIKKYIDLIELKQKQLVGRTLNEDPVPSLATNSFNV